MDAFRDDKDIGLRTVDWSSSCALLPGLILDMGQGGRLVVLAAEQARFSAIGEAPMLSRLKVAGRAVVDVGEE